MPHLRACDGCNEVYPTTLETWLRTRIGAWYCRPECYVRWLARFVGGGQRKKVRV